MTQQTLKPSIILPSGKTFAPGSVEGFRKWLIRQRIAAEIAAEADSDDSVDDDDTLDYPLAVVNVAPAVVTKPVEKLQRTRSAKPARMMKREQTDEALGEMVDWIRRHGPCTNSAVTKALWMNPSTATNRLNKLEGQGVVMVTWEIVKGNTKPSKFYTVVDEKEMA